MKKHLKRTVSVFESLTAVYLAGMLFVYLLFPGFGGYEQLTEHKVRLFYWLSGGCLILAALIRAELCIVGAAKPPQLKKIWVGTSVPEKLILLYWAVTGLSTVCAIDRATAFWGSGRMEGFLTITLYCGCFLLVARWGRPARWMLWLFGAAMALNCLLALIQMAGFNPLTLYPHGMTYYDADVLYAGEFLGTLGNVDILSAVLCVAIPALWVALAVLRGKRRFFLLIPLTLCIATLLGSFVAGGIVGIIGSALLIIPTLGKTKPVRRRLAVVMVVILALGIVAVYCFGGQIGGFIAEASALLHGHWDDSFGSGRLFIWRNVVGLLPERLLLGGGPDTLGLRLDAVFERYDETLGVLIRSTIDNAHNEYLNILVNQGLPALLLYLAALCSAAVPWLKHGHGNPAAAVCGSAVLGYCVQAFFGVSSPISAPYFWLALGLLTASMKFQPPPSERLEERSQ